MSRKLDLSYFESCSCDVVCRGIASLAFSRPELSWTA